MAILERINHLFKKGESVTLPDFIRDGVICFMQARSRDEALQKLVQALDEAGKLVDKEEFYHAIAKREKIVSTGIGMGVAIPHAKLSTYDDFFIAVGIQKNEEGIEWDALDGAPVKLIFMIGGPSDQQTDYLKILSGLTAAIKREGLQKSLLEAESHEEIVQLFKSQIS